MLVARLNLAKKELEQRAQALLPLPFAVQHSSFGCTAESDRDVNRGWSELTPVDASALLIVVILCYLYFITSAITILA